MDQLVYGITAFFILYFGGKALRMYRGYKGHIYQVLFASYLEYFFRYAIRKDCSQSTSLKEALGTHRMIFSIARDRQGAVTDHFLLLVYNKGIVLTAFLNPGGSVKCKNGDAHWYIHKDQDGKNVRIANPALALSEYRRRIEAKAPGLEIRLCLAVDDQTDISGIRDEVPVVHYSELIAHLKASDALFISDEMLLNGYQNLLKSEEGGQDAKH